MLPLALLTAFNSLDYLLVELIVLSELVFYMPCYYFNYMWENLIIIFSYNGNCCCNYPGNDNK